MVSKKKILLVLLLGLFFMSMAAGVSIHKSVQTPSPSPKVAYGVNVDMTAMISDTPYTITTASGGNFFDLAKQLDINTLRITDVQWEMTGEEYSQAIWHSVFD